MVRSASCAAPLLLLLLLPASLPDSLLFTLWSSLSGWLEGDAWSPPYERIAQNCICRPGNSSGMWIAKPDELNRGFQYSLCWSSSK